jgi:hypothetical protein
MRHINAHIPTHTREHTSTHVRAKSPSNSRHSHTSTFTHLRAELEACQWSRDLHTHFHVRTGASTLKAQGQSQLHGDGCTYHTHTHAGKSIRQHTHTHVHTPLVHTPKHLARLHTQEYNYNEAYVCSHVHTQPRTEHSRMMCTPGQPWHLGVPHTAHQLALCAPQLLLSSPSCRLHFLNHKTPLTVTTCCHKAPHTHPQATMPTPVVSPENHPTTRAPQRSALLNSNSGPSARVNSSTCHCCHCQNSTGHPSSR